MNSLALGSVLLIFAQLFDRRAFRQWLSVQAAANLPQGPGPKRRSKSARRHSEQQPKQGYYERIFTLSVTLWYMIFQRLSADKTLSHAVKDARQGGADRLSPSTRKPISKKIRSPRTSSYNQARQRMPLELLQWALSRIGQQVKGLWKPKQAQELTFQLIDGSTLAMLTNPAIAQKYPPARNQSGTSDWCLMRVVVGFCARTGVVLSAMEAPVRFSEQALAWMVMATAMAATVWIGDRNFGIWSIAAQALRHQQQVLVRLTQARAARLAGGQNLQSGQEMVVTWRRTRHDKIAPATEDQQVVGRLIFVRVRRDGKFINLWLFTTLMDTGAFAVHRLVELYRQRWQAEINFRYVKTALGLHELSVESPEMARKEFYVALIAYSLVRTVMAAAPADPHMPALSFSEVRRVLVFWLAVWGKDYRSRKGSLLDQTRALLAQAKDQTLPKRKKRRCSEPRRTRHRRMKFPPLIGSRDAARLKLQNENAKSC